MIKVGFITLLSLFAASGVYAQSACTNQSLSGAYTYAISGEYIYQNVFYHISGMGRFVADGQGGFAGKETISDGAVITRGRLYIGSYTVNADCTGTMVLTYANGTANIDFVITNNGKNVNLIQADPGTNIAGTAIQQFSAQ